MLNISYKVKEIITTKHLIEQGYNEKSIMDYFNVSKGRAYYMIKNANSLAMPELKKYYDTLADLDYKIKSGEIDPKLGLELWLLGVNMLNEKYEYILAFDFETSGLNPQFDKIIEIGALLLKKRR